MTLLNQFWFFFEYHKTEKRYKQIEEQNQFAWMKVFQLISKQHQFLHNKQNVNKYSDYIRYCQWVACK